MIVLQDRHRSPSWDVVRAVVLSAAPAFVPLSSDGFRSLAAPLVERVLCREHAPKGDRSYDW